MPVLNFNTQPSNIIVNARNGLTKVGSFVELGGTLIKDTTVTGAGFNFVVTNNNFQFAVSDANSKITGIYEDAQTLSNVTVSYDSGSGYSTAALQTIDKATGNETGVSAAYDGAQLGFTDATIPAMVIKVKATTNGIEIEGNKNDTSINTVWRGYDGVSGVDLATIFNNGNWQLNLYPNTRDDTGTFTPTSILYTGSSGELYNAPLSAIGAGLWVYDAPQQSLYDARSSGTGSDNFVVGNGLNAAAHISVVAIGVGLGIGGDGVIVIGDGAATSATQAISLGGYTADSQAIAIGYSATAVSAASNAVLIGPNFTGNIGSNSVGVGNAIDGADKINSIILGASSVCANDNEFVIGTQTLLTFASVTNITTAALVAFDDDAAAGVGGLTTGQWYQTTGGGAAPLNAAGIVMQKQ